MKIQFVTNSIIPAKKYGGKERALWSLLKGLSKQGHELLLLAPHGSQCPFVQMTYFQSGISLDKQIDSTADIVHFDYPVQEEFTPKPYICRQGGNAKPGEVSAKNTVFVSRDHARRHGGEFFIYNGLDPEEYGDPSLNKSRKYIHFLAKAAWKVKNLKGAVEITKKAGEKLEVIGGNRLNLKMGMRFTPDLHVRFHGIIGGKKKLNIIRESKGLIFPVLWHEPFGNAMMESMYYGCPVIGTPYGILPEIINPEVGFLSKSKVKLTEQIKDIESFDRKRIHEYIMQQFTLDIMANNYLKAYELILSGKSLNSGNLIAKKSEPFEQFQLTD